MQQIQDIQDARSVGLIKIHERVRVTKIFPKLWYNSKTKILRFDLSPRYVLLNPKYQKQ